MVRFQIPAVQLPSEYQTSLVFKWTKCVQLLNGLFFEWWSENWTKTVYFMVQNVRYLYGLPNHMIRLFGNRTKKGLKSQMFGYQVFGIQMVTVYK